MSSGIRRLVRGGGLTQFAFLLVLLIPLLPGTWALSELAARRETSLIDAHLRNALNDSVNEYQRVLDGAQEKARRVAFSTSVQKAFAAHDAAALRRLEERRHGVLLLLPGDHRGADGLTASVDVVDGGRRIGQVVVPVHLNQALVRRLKGAAGLDQGERLVVFRGGSAADTTRAQVIPVGGVDYRAFSANLRVQPPWLRIAVLREESAVRAAVSDARRRTVVVAFVALLAVAMLAYLFAPALAQSRLRRRERSQAERLLSNLSDGVLEIDDGSVAFVNPAAESLLGVPADELLGNQAPELVRGHEGAFDVRVGSDGRERWLGVVTVETEEGRVYTFRDVTRERRLDEMRAELIATVSHELRTPLAAVYGAARTLQRTPALEDRMREQLIGIIGNQAERLARIVDDILTASRAAAGDSASRTGPFDAVAVAEAVVHDAAERTGRPITLDAEERPRANGSPEDLRRVLDNLVDNAVKYTPAEAPIEVRVANGGETVRIEVVDNGPGIPRNEQDRIFERFYRLDPDMARGVGGTGLGLYIAKELVERMGGRLVVSSEPGHGATFVTELPTA
ncbi:MAG TPA: ATP-binding protein [Gaiellaceae bacterium]|nr:ATP-binding protein [Gaiellaceae bacterium]